MSEVTQLQKHLEDTIATKQLAEKALRLSVNPDFKDVILEAFCVRECARYAQLSADPSLDARGQADALALAQAAGHLRRFLSVIVQMGSKAENDIPSIQEAIVEAQQAEDAQ